jgi:hypothetical protein
VSLAKFNARHKFNLIGFSSRDDIVPAPVVEPPLNGFQILLIICAIMFLSLLLLGLGCSYYCLRNRTIPAIARPFSTLESDSEITKMSDSSLGMIC